MKICLSIVGLIALFAASIRGQSLDSRVTFATRVATYTAIRREVERQMLSGGPSSDLRGQPAGVSRFRAAIRLARPHSREGDVFTPAADALRRDLRRTLRERGLEPNDLVAEMLDDTEAGARPPIVNEPFSWALGNAMPPSLIAALPALPAEVEYRLVGPHLVLIDIDADLVIDILRDAILDTANTEQAPVQSERRRD